MTAEKRSGVPEFQSANQTRHGGFADALEPTASSTYVVTVDRVESFQSTGLPS